MKRARHATLLFLLILALPLCAASVFCSSPNTEDQGGSYYSGTVYTGSHLRIGVNDYGALGVYDASLGDVGFQYPIGYGYESLAVGWWGDGWSVFYGGEGAGFSPADGAWGTISGVTPIVTSRPTPYGHVHVIEMNTSDNVLKLLFKVEFFNAKKYVKVETHITNIGELAITDLEFKRIVDWDVWQPTIGDFDNYWGVDDVRRPDLNLAVAFLNSSVTGGPSVYMGFASLERPTNYDLNWDDYGSRGFILPPLHGSITVDGKAPFFFDGAVVYQWLLGELKPGETKVIHTIYAAGDTLEELENNVGEALRQYRPPVGGVVMPVEAPAPDLATIISVALAVAVAAAAMAATRRLIKLKPL